MQDQAKLAAGAHLGHKAGIPAADQCRHLLRAGTPAADQCRHLLSKCLPHLWGDFDGSLGFFAPNEQNNLSPKI